MMGKGTNGFIYVFNQEDADKLLALGYELLTVDRSGFDKYIFVNTNRSDFSETKIKCCISNTLRF